ncbi:hypothetical protein ASU31_07475 [Pedobacter ginsenosidimutans]|uniref:Uncharacterized protein n=1 Tax=Pedobacter ginsenosidimutans TaxID=687842 RepID=A0A0T5VS19_9SPHI|nr:hypothetical protein [Pedobacter ginsenosidimutans]KRT16647.1 hypothetical protein ASU31_07475 [Pedobacter ginsenosidimutans]
MRVTLEIADFDEMKKLLSLFQTMKLESIKIISPKNEVKPNILKGDKTINPKDLFGIWKDAPKNIEDIRTKAWDRK